ncbi:hypothetical protein [Natronorubrum halophilum]|uniref:hypothetical protein n=1 Tax=Natronorubrum halophilum TaxID=1702106 RepID=UPI0010C200EA|nr:hypothetical protein [Natronorubrum halophilum]
MSHSNREQSRIANNRLAVALVVGSLLVVAAVGALYRSGILGALLPARGPAVDAVPLYVLVAVSSLALVVWGWSRLLSWFG